MAACPLVDVLACAQLVVVIKGDVAEVRPGQLESRAAWGCCFLPSLFGNIKGKLDLLWGCLGVSLQKKNWSCAQRPVTYSVTSIKEQGQEKSLGFLPLPESSLTNNSYSDVTLFHSLGMLVLFVMIACCLFFFFFPNILKPETKEDRDVTLQVKC